MPCKIIPPQETCSNSIANIIGKLQAKIAAIGDITTAYPLIQKAVRHGENGSDRDYPRMEYTETVDSVIKYEELDLFPGLKVEDNYCFFERLSETVIDSGDGYATMKIGILFYFRDTNRSLRELVSRHAEAIRLMTEVGDLRIEERIKEVWREYGYDVKDFGQFQAPHVTFKITVDAQFYNECC